MLQCVYLLFKHHIYVIHTYTDAPGIAYIVVGSVSLMFALLFLSKQAISPRMVADPALLNWH